jgi:hypothetical protein
LYDVVKLRGGGFGWKLRNVRAVKPIKAQGRLGLWSYSRNTAISR